MLKETCPGICREYFERNFQQTPEPRIYGANNIQKETLSQAKSIKKLKHDPKNPKFFIVPPDNKPRHKAIQKGMRNIEKAYYQRKGWLVNLLLLNPSFRQKYSQRMEAICAVSQALLYYTDFQTCQVGIPRKGRAGLLNLSIKKISEVTKLTICRVKNALRDLKKAIYLTAKKEFSKDALKKGLYRSVYSVKRLTRLFLYHIGITEENIRAIQRYKQQIVYGANSEPTYFLEEIQRIRVNAVKTNSYKKYTEKIPGDIVSILKRQFLKFSK